MIKVLKVVVVVRVCGARCARERLELERRVRMNSADNGDPAAFLRSSSGAAIQSQSNGRNAKLGACPNRAKAVCRLRMERDESRAPPIDGVQLGAGAAAGPMMPYALPADEDQFAGNSRASPWLQRPCSNPVKADAAQ